MVKSVHQQDDVHLMNLLKEITINEKINIGNNNTEIESDKLELEITNNNTNTNNTKVISKLNIIKNL